MNKYAFLIGAHKAGTTFLNKTLRLNNSQVRSNGVWFESTETVKPNVSTHLSRANSQAQREQILDYIRQDKRKYHRVIFSNENLSGTIPSFFKRQSLYPNIADRIAELSAIMQGKAVDLFLVVRSYDKFVSSCYSEFIRARGFDIGFREFQDAVLSSEPSWVNIVERVQTAYPNATIKVLQQQDIANDLDFVLTSITGLDCSSFKLPAKFEGRQSLSESGMDVLALMQHFGYDSIEPEFINRLAMILPSSKHFGRPFYMSQNDAEYYSERYQHHIDELSRSKHLLVNSQSQ